MFGLIFIVKEVDVGCGGIVVMEVEFGYLVGRSPWIGWK